jgi:hypothetical protein
VNQFTRFGQTILHGPPGTDRQERVMSDNDAIICDFCKKGKVALKPEEMTFRQSSDKG